MDKWQSEAIDQLVAAIVQAQLKMAPAKKEATNPFFHSRYADLPTCWEAARPFLEADIAIVQSPMEGSDGYVLLDTQLSHVSGQWMRSRLKVRVAKDDPQGYGSAITYMRRYALGCMTGLVTEEDDDGNAASHPQPQPRQFTPHKQTAQAKINELRTEGLKPEPQAARTAGEVIPPTKQVITPQASDRAPAPSDDSPAFIWRVGAKHKGESIRTIPDDYLTWFAENGKAADHVQAANDEIDRRMGQASADYSDGEAVA
jgi:ERF superfamily